MEAATTPSPPRPRNRKQCGQAGAICRRACPAPAGAPRHHRGLGRSRRADGSARVGRGTAARRSNERPGYLIRALFITLTAGLVWQFVLVMALVRREQGSLRLSVLRDALWLRALVLHAPDGAAGSYGSS